MRSAPRRATSPTSSSTRSAARAASSAINFAIALPARRRRPGRRHAARRDRAAHRLHRRADRRRLASRSAPTSRARRCRPSSAAWTACRGSSRRCAARGFDDEAVAKITHGNWLRVLGETWRRWGRYFELAGDDPRETLVDALDRFDAPGPRRRPRRGHGPRHGRAAAPRLERDRDRRRARGDRRACTSSSARRHRGSRRVSRASRSETWPTCDLVNASFSLPFAPPGAFDALWARIVASLRPGGRFCGQLFGVNDEWAGTGITSFTRARGRAAAGAVRDRAPRGGRRATARPSSARASTGTCSTSSRASGSRGTSTVGSASLSGAGRLCRKSARNRHESVAVSCASSSGIVASQREAGWRPTRAGVTAELVRASAAAERPALPRSGRRARGTRRCPSRIGGAAPRRSSSRWSAGSRVTSIFVCMSMRCGERLVPLHAQLGSAGARAEHRLLRALVVSVVGLGCNNFGWRMRRGADARVVDAALDAGITLFDTAESYGHGDSEVFLGRALAGRRDRAVIATKFGWGRGRDDNSDRARRRRRTSAPRSTSRCARLGTDYVDLYQYHRPDGVTPIEETLGAMDELVRAGKVRYIGSSNFSAAQVEEADAVAARRGLARFVSAQNEYSWLKRDAEDDLIPACERLGLGLLPYFPLARGLLTGKYRRGEPPPEGTRLAAQGLGFARKPGVPDGSGTGSRRSRRSRATAGSGCSTSRSAGSPPSRRSRSVIAGATTRRAGARERRGGRVGALGRRARRAARAVASPRGAAPTTTSGSEMAARWDRRRNLLQDSTREISRVARRPPRSAAGPDDPRARRRHGRDGLPRCRAPRARRAG